MYRVHTRWAPPNHNRVLTPVSGLYKFVIVVGTPLILLMEEIFHHLGWCQNPVNNKIFTISTGEFARFLNHQQSSTVRAPYLHFYHGDRVQPCCPSQETGGTETEAKTTAAPVAEVGELGNPPWWGVVQLEGYVSDEPRKGGEDIRCNCSEKIRDDNV